MIQMTESAARHIHKMLAARGRGEYAFGWDAAPKPGDAVFSGADGATVFVDPKSLRLLEGSVLDYDTSLLSKGFVISNPHAKSTCGCGTSFSVEEREGQ